MAGNKGLGLREVGVVEARPLIRAPEHRQHLPLDFNGWHSLLPLREFPTSNSQLPRPVTSSWELEVGNWEFRYYSSNPTQCVRFSILPRFWASSILFVIQ